MSTHRVLTTPGGVRIELHGRDVQRYERPGHRGERVVELNARGEPLHSEREDDRQRQTD